MSISKSLARLYATAQLAMAFALSTRQDTPEPSGSETLTIDPQTRQPLRRESIRSAGGEVTIHDRNYITGESNFIAIRRGPDGELVSTEYH